MNEYLDMWKHYADFSTCTSRRGYWMAFLFNTIAGLILGGIASLLPALTFLSSLYSLAALVPGLAITVRRLKDIGKPWGWIFISLVPLVGAIILIVMLCKPSVNAENSVSA